MRAAAATAAQRPAPGAAGEPTGGPRRTSAHRSHAQHLHDFHEVDIQGRWAEPLPARWSYTPTLYTAPKSARLGRPSELDKPEVDPVCALVLSSFDEPSWNGRCRCTVDEQEAWFEMLDQDGSGSLDYSEVQQVMEASKTTFQRMLPGSVHGVLIESCVQDAFHSSFNEDHDPFLDLEEWNHFLDTLERRFLRYRKLLSFQSERAFYGRGWSKWLDQSNDIVPNTPKGGAATPQGSESTSEDMDWAYFEENAVKMIAAESKGLPKHAMQFGVDPDAKEDGMLLPVGWREDFWYYTCNYHPICGIFFCDPDHQLNWFERVQIELATIFSLFIASDFKDTLKKEEAASLERVDNDWVLFLKLFGDAAIWMVGVLGGMLVYYVFYLLFTCPQLGFVDESSASAQERFRAKVADRAGATIGYLLMLFLVVFVYYDWQVLERNWFLVLVGRSLAYLSYFFFFVAIPFNPVFAWGSCTCNGAVDAGRKFGLLGRAGDLIGIGQWRIQKQIFQAQCRKVVEEALFPRLESSNKTTMKSLLRMSTDEWNAHRIRKIAAEFRRPLEARRGHPRGHLRRRQECAPAREPPGGRGVGRAAAPALTLQLVGDVFSQADHAWRSWIGGKPWRELKE